MKIPKYIQNTLGIKITALEKKVYSNLPMALFYSLKLTFFLWPDRESRVSWMVRFEEKRNKHCKYQFNPPLTRFDVFWIKLHQSFSSLNSGSGVLWFLPIVNLSYYYVLPNSLWKLSMSVSLVLVINISSTHSKLELGLLGFLQF